MGRVFTVTVTLASLLLGATPAHARDYYFFNKQGVTRQDYLADRVTCDNLAGATTHRGPDMTAANNQIWQNPNLSVGQAAAAAGIASFMLAFVAASERRRLVRQVERICLADKGYRRFEMRKEAYRAIEKSPEMSVRIDKWFALASADKPDGKEMYE
jgi:hypothetical protein